MIAFPINVAPKNVPNGIPHDPQIIPAKSNNGFGICKWYKFRSVI
jgi:hypothetical protein